MTEATPTIADILASITPDQAEQFDLQALAASARGEGVEAVCDFGECVFSQVAAKHHRVWIERILAYLRFAGTAPPASGKTTWITQITMAWWIGKHPYSANGIGSAGDDAAQRMAAAVANTIELNPRWKLVFPTLVPNKDIGWSSMGYNIIDTADPDWARRRYGNKNATLTAGGVGSAIWNGLRISDDGLMVLDDIHDFKSMTQQATCDNTVAWFKFTAENRLETNSRLAVPQTRWNGKDVIAHCKTRPDFKVYEHPAIETDEAGVEHSYWPKVRPLENLQAIRERDLSAFELQYQGNDRAVEGVILKTAWLLPFPGAEIKREWNRYFGIDFAKRVKELLGKNDDPDHFALAVFVDTGSRLVLEEMFDALLFMADAEEFFFSQAAQYQPQMTGIETNGNGNEYYLNLLKRMRVKGLHYPVRGIHSKVDLGIRLSQVVPYFKTGQIMVADTLSAGLAVFRSQWATFPRAHDDTLSAVVQGWKVAEHLLPADAPETVREQRAARAAYVSPARAIEHAYGIG